MRAWRGNLDRPGVRKVLANTAWLGADHVVRLGAGFVVGVVVARYLGPDQFGLLSYAAALVALLGSVVTLGTDQVVVRELVARPDAGRSVLASAVVVRIAGALAGTVLAVAAALLVDFQDPRTRTILVLFALAIPFRPFEVADLWFQAQTNSRPAAVARSAAFLVISAVKVGLVVLGASVIAFAACEPLAALLATVLLLLAFARHGRRFGIAGSSGPEVGRILRISWPLLLSGMAITVYSRIDQVMLEAMLGAGGTHAVGVYSVALRFSEVWYFVPMAISASVFPTIVESRRLGAHTYETRLARLFSLVTAIALALAVPVTLLAGPIVELAFGTAYAGAGPILAVHVWTNLFVFWGVIGEMWYVSEGLTRFTLYRTVSAALMNVAMNLVLIPRYGGIGAAAATLASQASASWLFNLVDPRTRPIFFMQLRSLAMRDLFS